MPRAGGVYSKPIPDVIAGYTIGSTEYNQNVDDVVVDLNTPRPVIAGGTGSANAAGARTNLQAEVAAATVTNLDSQVWEPGSWKGTHPLVGAPDSTHDFVGSAEVFDPTWVALEATALQTGVTYRRTKQAGVWSAWAIMDGSDKVSKAGDTMTGPLTTTDVTATSGHYYFSDGSRYVQWDGTQFLFNYNLHALGDIIADNGYLQTTMPTPDRGLIQFGNTGLKTLQYDGANFQFQGGPLITENLTSTGGHYYFSDGSRYLQWTGAEFLFNYALRAVGTVNAEGGIVGKADASSAAAGIVGEYAENNSGAFSPTAGVWTAAMGIALTPGDWDVFVSASFSNTTAGYIAVCALTAANAGSGNPRDAGAVTVPAGTHLINAGPVQFNISSSTTVYCNVYSGVSGTTVQAFIRARRVR